MNKRENLIKLFRMPPIEESQSASYAWDCPSICLPVS